MIHLITKYAADHRNPDSMNDSETGMQSKQDIAALETPHLRHNVHIRVQVTARYPQARRIQEQESVLLSF
jgi:hypothetical protein